MKISRRFVNRGFKKIRTLNSLVKGCQPAYGRINVSPVLIGLVYSYSELGGGRVSQYKLVCKMPKIMVIYLIFMSARISFFNPQTLRNRMNRNHLITIFILIILVK